MPATPTNRFYPLPDGRTLTWSHCPTLNATGSVVVDEHADGHVDGVPIPDDLLRELLRANGLAPH